MSFDQSFSSANHLPLLLESGVRVLSYVGEWDFIVNWIGVLSWMNALEWYGQENFKTAPVVKLPYGQMKGWQNLEFIRTSNSGHMLPMDNPKGALEQLTDFVWGPFPYYVDQDL